MLNRTTRRTYLRTCAVSNRRHVLRYVKGVWSKFSGELPSRPYVKGNELCLYRINYKPRQIRNGFNATLYNDRVNDRTKALYFRFTDLPPRTRQEGGSTLHFQAKYANTIRTRRSNCLLLILRTTKDHPSGGGRVQQPFPKFIYFRAQVYEFIQYGALHRPTLRLTGR